MRPIKLFYELKEKHPDAILLFHYGNDYECYKEDAKQVAEVLDINLVCDINDGIIASFPHHALDAYLHKLIRAGLRVAICNQYKPRI